MTLPDLLEKAVLAVPDEIFIFYEQQKITYREFSRRVTTVATALRRAGVEPGDRVALMLTNRPEYLTCWFAAATVGAIEVPVNPQCRTRELRYILNHAGAKWIFIEPSNAPELTQIRSELASLKRVVVLAEREGPDDGADPLDSWERFLDEAPRDTRFDKVKLSPDDPVAIIYTSGTTGHPKGVVLSHRSAVLTGESTAFMLGASSSDRIMTPNPLFHVNAQFHGAVTALAAQTSFILLERFHRSQILEQARFYGATILLLAAAATSMMFSRATQDTDSSTALRTLLTGGVPPEIYDAFEKRFQLRIQTAFALTEAPVALMAPGSGVRKPTPGVGIPMSHPDPTFRNEVQITDDKGLPVPPLRQGEMWVRNAAVMTGYWNNPEKTQEYKHDGWIRTGDLGYEDEEGYFHFVGRSRDVIRRRGELIAPAEIESVLNEHAEVEESAVLGAPSGLGIGEEEIVAYVVTVSGASVSPAELRQWCETRLSRFKVPGTITFRDQLPKTSLGKIRKSALSSCDRK